MFKKKYLSFLLAFFLIFTTVFSSIPAQYVKAQEPTTVVANIVGNFQKQLGDTDDWKVDSTITVMIDKGNGLYEYTTQSPLKAGDYEYKVALNHSWDGGGIPAQGNLKFHLDKDTAVTFWFNYKTSSVTDSTKYTQIPQDKLPRLAGTIQSAIGAGKDWDPASSTAIMTDDNFDNVYEYTAHVPKGYYEYKVILGNDWNNNNGIYGDPKYGISNDNIPLNVAYDTDITFYYNSTTHAITTNYNPALTGSDNNIYYDSLKHDTHDPFFRCPFGAIKEGQTVTLRLQAKNHDLESAKISYWDEIDKTRTEVPMTKIGESPDGQYEYWEVKLSFDHPTRIWYYFILKDGTKTAYYGDNDEQLGGVGKATDTVNKDFELTVYDKNFDTPDWMKGAVMYQIFPDRFFNGDTSNDQAKTLSRGNDPIELHSNWNDLPDNPNDKGKPGYKGDGIWSNDFFGGDLKGIDDKLDYLKNLGVNVIYLNPIFDSPSNHKYDTTDYSKIDPMFGTAADFEKLMEDAHSKGMKVILDGVFNHTSDDSIYFDRYGKYSELGAYEAWKQGDQSKSSYGNWYKINPDGTYEGWWGYDSLPVIQALNGSEYNVAGWANYIINDKSAISKYWLNPDGNTNDGADGWRLDVENEVAHDFWTHFRDAINSVKPEAPMVAENWGDASLDLLGDSFNSVMNYQFRNAVIDFLIGKQFDDGNGMHNPIDASKLDQRLTSIYERYPLPAFYSTMNLLGSHDTMRILTVFGYNSADPNANSTDEKNLAESKLKLAAIFQMGYPGMADIYYGDEAGVSGAKDPDDRRTFPWGNEDTSLQDFFKTIANIRDNNQVLKTGDLETLYAQDDVYAIGRRIINGKDAFDKAYPDSAAIVAINRSNTDKQIAIDTSKFLRDGVTFKDLLNDSKAYTNIDGQIVVDIPAMSGVMLISDSGQDLTAPAVVTGLTATPGNGKVDLSWTASDGASGYNIYRSTVDGGLYEKIASNIKATTYSDTTVTNGLKYVYAITAKDDVGNESDKSSDTIAYPAYPIGWVGNLTDVASNHMIGVNNPTEDIYAEVWADGLTNKQGQGQNMIAQLGYKYDSVSDSVYGSVYNSVYGVADSSGFIWVNAEYVGDSGNNDKYKASFLPDKIGTWEYKMRFSDDQGQNWKETDVKFFTVVPSDDLEKPTVPVLQQPGIESSRVSLSWSPANDNVGIYKYEIYRSSGGFYEKIATVANDVYNFIDTSVVNGTIYTYKVVAADLSFNRSESNAVTITPKIVPIQATFNVKVPDYTPDGVNLVGSFPDVQWNPSAQAMTKVGDNTYSITLTLNEGTQLEYKYARGSWDKVEKDEYGNELANNRKVTIVNQGDNKMVINDTVARWRDIPLYIYSPSDNSTVSSDTTSIEIKGNTYKGAKITINGESFVQADNGKFTKNVSLDYGLNKIAIHFEPNDESVYGNDKGRISELTKDLVLNVTRESLSGNNHPSGDNNGGNPSSIENNSLSNNNGSTTNDLGTVSASGNTTTLSLDASKTLAAINNTQGSQVTIDLTSVGTTKEKAAKIPKEVINAAKDSGKDIVIKSDNTQLVLSKDSFDLNNVGDNITVSIKDNGKANVEKYMVLSNTVDISIKSGDNNVTFTKPVKVTLNIQKANDVRKVAVYYYNETTGKWEYVGGKADKDKNTITFNAKHFSQYAVFEYDKKFNDIKTHWAKDVIEVLASRQIVEGINENNFVPDKTITRAEYAAMMTRLLGIPEETYKGEFSDVKTGDWYANAIEAAYKAGIILGDGSNMRPNDNITREEMAAIAMRVYGKLTTYNEEQINKTTFNDDNMISDWAKNVVANASKIGILEGEPNNLFVPKSNATRAEAAAVIYRLLDKSGNI
ncbi:alpha amylase N-terminal ig-like domain-containing protein [Thermoanaerobacterium sp. RBIITD]|uniref:alpha amylase N-terminal ig-like domain-containing protein n=1 Tax=Thermoanaerobacterium sp. RBIITD TaxID=1550240 RepID=UPI000BB6D7B9|nr:alpha amylase N-terminal ig-like domain-containing protein [Thermoanaerobacterium sp. RBIITD]SNX53839.1 Glycosidase [Thermoanaerobacterium sp. RBIITD]